MDRLTAIAVFVEVAERGSLTAAAETLELSRAMVSRYLAGLERWLGVRLLHRTTRRVALTGAGQTALARFRPMLAIGASLREELASDDPEPHGQLRVTASASFGQAHLAAAATEFVARYPQARVDMLLADRAVNLIEERIDLAVRISHRVDPGLIARRLSVCRSVLCAAPAYLQRHGAPRTAADLAAHNCLCHHYVGKHAWPLRYRGERVSVSVRGNFTTNEAIVLLEAVRIGAGIAMLPTYQAAGLLRSGQLRRVLPDHELDTMDIFGVYASRRQQPAIVRVFLDFLVARFGEAPHWDRD
ncbi:LysR family transcriptional regulator [Xanthomonas theicola]|uniref:LysR family transcriptional regulator n=1 Tax=Xanthomonas theicola TaxID=56464 RepID=A0A2S6ZBG2_9XANT|nr:LysR family transcriptional regulator [Xanthomonas theicola]PPT83356.1 LysR family transcriptional regulator [Xanthomonas theicola]QNH23928.1 LysR family transcriptional regulator [Xanthomonas theicola]